MIHSVQRVLPPVYAHRVRVAVYAAASFGHVDGYAGLASRLVFTVAACGHALGAALHCIPVVVRVK